MGIESITYQLDAGLKVHGSLPWMQVLRAWHKKSERAVLSPKYMTTYVVVFFVWRAVCRCEKASKTMAGNSGLIFANSKY